MTLQRKFATFCSVVGLAAAFTACDRDHDRRVGVNDVNKDQEHERVVGIEGEANKPEVDKGTGEIKVQKEQTRTITSEEKVPTVVEGKTKLDINRMNKGDFEALGFSKDVAGRIVDYRDKHNGFRSIDELSQVPGVSAAQIAPFRDKLGLSPKH